MRQARDATRGPAGSKAGSTCGKTDLHRKSARSAGFTLLEVLIAVTILGVAIVSLLGLHARDVRLIAEAQDITIAGALASDILSVARVDPDLEDGVLEGRFVSELRQADGKQSVYGGPDSIRFVWTREVLPTGLPNLRQIRVHVRLAGEMRDIAELWSVVRQERATL